MTPLSKLLRETATYIDSDILILRSLIMRSMMQTAASKTVRAEDIMGGRIMDAVGVAETAGSAAIVAALNEAAAKLESEGK